MNLATIHSLWTVLLMILFLGIVVWAYSSRRKQQFDAAARMPLEDEDSHLLSLTPTPSPEGRGGRAERACARPGSLGGEPSALRATSFTRGDEKNG